METINANKIPKKKRISWESIGVIVAIAAVGLGFYFSVKSNKNTINQLEQAEKQFAYQIMQDSIQKILYLEQIMNERMKDSIIEIQQNEHFIQNLMVMSEQANSLKNSNDYLISTQRPIFTPLISIVPPLSGGREINVQVILQNFGVRPAKDVVYTLVSISDDFKSEHHISTGNLIEEFTPQTKLVSMATSLHLTHPFVINTPIDTIYFAFKIEYKDILIKKNYVQRYYFEWWGITSSFVELTPYVALPENVELINLYLENLEEIGSF